MKNIDAPRIAVEVDPAAPPGQVVPALARLLRRLRDNAGRPAGGQHPAASDSRPSLPGRGHDPP